MEFGPFRDTIMAPQPLASGGRGWVVPMDPEVLEMFRYFEEHTYFGPHHEAHIAAARALVPGGFTTLDDWARIHLKPM